MAHAGGKPRNLDSPDELWQLYLKYKKEVKNTPRIRVQYVGKDGERVETPIERPLQVDGFITFCYDHVGSVRDYIYSDRYPEYSTIATRIREDVRTDQIDGGMTGDYNANLTARLNGLADKQSHQVHVEQPLFPEP